MRVRDAVATLLLEVIEERADERRVDVRQEQSDGALPTLRLRESEEQPECVAVGGDRVRTRPSLPLETVGEERFE